MHDLLSSYSYCCLRVSPPKVVVVMDGNHVGDNTGDRVDEERLILSEVHLGNSALDESEVVSRYTYLTPGARDHRHGDTGSSSSISSSSDSEDRSSDITRRRKRHRSSTRSCRQRASRTPHEVLTVVHRSVASRFALQRQIYWQQREIIL